MPAQPTLHETATPTTSAIAAAPQAMLVDAALAALREQGYRVRRGTYADLDTAEVALVEGQHLVLLPMAETMWGDQEDLDVDVWHVLAIDSDGEHLEWAPDQDWPWHCPSVLWAHSIGLEPASAVFLVQAVLADDDLQAHFGLSA